jgi:AcrR family transcriptional regulator
VHSPSPSSPPELTSGRRWTRRKEARPQELVAAALGHFIRDGYHAARLDDIARSANVSKGTVYLYFADKEALFKAVIRENLSPVLAEGEELITRHEGTTAELLQCLIGGWWEMMGKSPASGLAKLVMAESARFPNIARFYYDEVIARADALFRRAIQQGIDRGEFRNAELPATTAALTAPMVFLMMWNHSFGICISRDFTPEDFIDSYVNLALFGLVKRPDDATLTLASQVCQMAAAELAERHSPLPEDPA